MTTPESEFETEQPDDEVAEEQNKETAPDGSKEEPTFPTIAEILEIPALFPGESVDAFDLLLEEVKHELQPKDLFDRLNAMDIANSVWEATRLRKLAANVTDNARVNALAILLGPFLNQDHNAAMDHAAAAYGPTDKKNGPTDKKKRAEALEILRRCKITDAKITAQAYQMNSFPMTVIDRGITNRDNLRRSLIKEHRRSLKKAEKARQAVSDAPPIAPVSTPSDIPAPTTGESPPLTANDNAGETAPTQFPKRRLKRRWKV